MNSSATDCKLHTAESEEHTSAILINAELYSEMGVPVFPCYEIRNGKCSCRSGVGCTDPGKHPRTKNGVSDATTDLNQLRAWAAKWPNANWAARTGGYLPKYGGYLVVLDIDPRHGGDYDLKAYEAKHGALPRRHLVRTGGGGLHYLLVSPEPVGKGKLGSGIDIQGEGCYIIAAGSNHKSGNSYEHVDGFTAEPFEWVPDSWLPLLPKPKQSPVLTISSVERSKTLWAKTTEGWQATDAKTGEVKGLLTDLSQRLPNAKLDAMIQRRREKWAEKRAKQQARQNAKQQTGQQQGEHQGQQDRRLGQRGVQKRVGLLGAICNICDCDPTDDVVSRIWCCLERCRVSGSAMTNDSVYGLACGLRNIPDLSGKTADELRPLIRFWYSWGKENMSKPAWPLLWKRWLRTWDKWSESQIGPAWDAARKLADPAFIAEAQQSGHAGKFILRAISNEIQEHAPDRRLSLTGRTAADKRWFLTCRTATDVLACYFGIEKTYKTVSVWIADLVKEEFLIKLDFRDESNEKTIWYVTAAYAALCDTHDRQQQDQTQATAATVDRVAMPLAASRGRLEGVLPVLGLSQAAGRDEPELQTLISDLAAYPVSNSQRSAVPMN